MLEIRSISKRRPLAVEVQDILREEILQCRLKPGQQLKEFELIEQLRVSRSPLREAFRGLEAEGLLIRRSRKGVYVRQITFEDVRELFPIRASLERLAAEEAVPRITVNDLEELEEIVDKMEKCSEEKYIKRYTKLNFEFHKKIVKIAKNKRLEKIIKDMSRQSMWFTFTTLYTQRSMDLAMSSHKKIFEALKKRDRELAGKEMYNHILEAGKVLYNIFMKIEATNEEGLKVSNWV